MCEVPSKETRVMMSLTLRAILGQSDHCEPHLPILLMTIGAVMFLQRPRDSSDATTTMTALSRL